jgi:glycosyltransferase involved in cell wall biosynthesis
LKLLVLSKRYPQGRDLLTRPYGRFYHLPRALAAAGHEVRIALLSYRRLPSESCRFDGIDWSSDDLLPSGPLAYLSRIRQMCRQWRPDWIIGCSDTYFGILATHYARTCGAHSLVDAYDNFESYMPWARPLHALWHRALRRADLVTAAGPALALRLRKDGARRCEVLPMCADPAFGPLDRAASRSTLGLPADRLLVGHLGAFDASRGHRQFLQAIERVRAINPDISLVLSGRNSAAFHSPPASYGLGYLADEQMPALVNSLDVACVSLADNAFGHYSHPAKLCEAMACEVPVVASETAATAWMLNQDPRFLTPLGNVAITAERIIANLDLDRVIYPGQQGWNSAADRLNRLLQTPLPG